MAQSGSVIVNKTNIAAIKKGLDRSFEETIGKIVNTLCYIGECCVKIAREDHAGNWNDITGNLRSSIAYTVLVDGKPVDGINGQFERFKGKSKGKDDGAQGVKQAKAFLRQLQNEYQNGIVLIVVAGMNYAAYVENIHHKVVLSQADLEAERLAKKLLRSLIEPQR